MPRAAVLGNTTFLIMNKLGLSNIYHSGQAEKPKSVTKSPAFCKTAENFSYLAKLFTKCSMYVDTQVVPRDTKFD